MVKSTGSQKMSDLDGIEVKFSEKEKILEEKTTDEKESILRRLPIVGYTPKNKAEEEFLKELIDYEFYNTEEPGTTLSFPYGDSKTNCKITLRHGEHCRLPRHIARHIDSRSVPMYQWHPNGTGKMVKTDMGVKSRFQMRQIIK